MTKEDKDLLLKDLCARLPYGVKVKFVFNKYIEKTNNFIYISDNGPSYIHNSCVVLTENNIKYVFNDWLDECKPYLRPLSSMTEEEKNEYALFYRAFSCSLYERESVERIDWLNSHHFDYRGLIEKGLALEAPNNMYKI